MVKMPLRERVGLGFQITDELGPHWIALEGEDILERIELAALLTLEFAEGWAAVFCYCGRAERPVSIAEIAAGLDLDLEEVSRCVRRLEEEKLVERGAQAGTFTLAVGKRTAGATVDTGDAL